MHKNKTNKSNKTNKRKNKYSKKTRRRNVCEKGVTDEVIRTRKLIKEIRSRSKRSAKK